MSVLAPADATRWPKLPHTEWTETIETLHMWSQIVGKVRMELSPWFNHSWSVPLYLTSRGLDTSPIPYGAGSFEMEFDFIAHELAIRTSDGRTRGIPLESKSVARFYGEVFQRLSELGIEVSIYPLPNEVPEPIPFPEDDVHDTYEPRHARRLWAALVAADRVMKEFRARFIGKVSPVHFFWGSFDMAVTRFSGREAPPHAGGIPNLPDEVTREAYSHEVTSCGFWPGNREAPDPIFYAYAYPTPDGFSEASVEPEAAFWLEELGEFALAYEAVREAASPDAAFLAFFEDTHAAAAQLLSWNREKLEWTPGYRPIPPYGS